MSKYIERQVVEVDLDLEKLNQSLKKVKTTATAALEALGQTIVNVSGTVISYGLEFESAFAGVRKSIEATDKEFLEIKKGILDLSSTIPLAANEIANIAEVAGQLGIKKENIMEFTRTMADLGLVTSLSSTEAAEALAKLGSLMETDQRKFDNMASTIVALNSDLSITGTEIMSMAQNIASAGKQVGLSEVQVLALAGGLSSIGGEAITGGEAISELLIKIKNATSDGGTNLTQLASVANMTAEEFKSAFEEDAGGVINSFIEGLETAGDRGIDVISVLNDAGLSDIQLTNALLSAAEASDVFGAAFEIANSAWNENTALMDAASEQYETAESKIKILQNSLEATGISVYDKFEVPFKNAVDGMIEIVGILSNEIANGQLGSSIDNISEALNGLISVALEVAINALPLLINAMTWLLDNASIIAAGIIGFNVALKGSMIALKALNAVEKFNIHMALAKKTTTATGIALAGYTAAAQGATAATTLFSKVTAGANALLGVTSGGLAMIAGAVVVGALAALTVGLMQSAKETHEAKYHTEEFNKALKESKEAAQETKEAISEAYAVYERQIQITESYAKKVDDLIDSNGNLIGTKEDLTTALFYLNQSLGEEMYWYDEATGKIMDQNGAVQDLTTSVEDLMTMKRAQAYIDANQANLENIYSQIADNKQNVVDITNANKELSANFNEEFGHMGMTLDEFVEKFKSIDPKDYASINELFSGAGGEDMQSKLAELSGHYIGNITKVEEYKKTIGDLNGQLEDYENILLAIETNNVDLADDILNGFKFDVEGLGLEELETAYDSAAQKLRDYYAAQRESGIDYSDEIKETTEELELLKEKIDILSEMDESKVKSDGNFMGRIFGDAIGLKTKEALGLRVTEVTEDTQDQLNDAGVVLPIKVRFQVPEIPYIRTSNVNTQATLFNDFGSPYSNIVSSMKSTPADVFSNIIGPISRGFSGVNVNVAGSSGGSSSIHQNVVFNQPVDNPSNITRAMNKLAREIRKAG